jgi:hypothetical protein
MDIYGRGFIAADFFTQTYRISARADTRKRSLANHLNDRLTSYLELHETFVSRLHKPSEIVASYNLASLRKDSITFVILAAEKEMSERHAYGYFAKQLYDVFLTMPSFEIRGKLQVTGKPDLHAFLVKGTENFISISNPVASPCLFPDISFTGGTVLVNKSRIELFCISETPSPLGKK